MLSAGEMTIREAFNEAIFELAKNKQVMTNIKSEIS